MPERQSSSSQGQHSRQERSAGVVVFVDAHDDAAPRRLFLLLDYGRHWDYPKGHLEAQEDDRTAALRELREETGIEAALVPGFSREISYRFRSARKGLVNKSVIFFVAQASDQRVSLSEEHVGYAWLERAAALRRLTFDNARQVLTAAADYLDEFHPRQREP